MATVIVDCESGNLHSAHKAFERVARETGADEIRVSSDPDEVRRACRIVLPGDGAFPACRKALFDHRGLFEAMQEAVVAQGRPFMGICIGMQLMATRGTEHAETPGFGWIGGTVEAIRPEGGLKISILTPNERKKSIRHYETVKIICREGTLEFCLATLNDHEKFFRTDEIAKKIRAEGDSEFLLITLNDLMRLFPNNEIAKKIRAEGDPEFLLIALNDLKRLFPNDEIFKTIRTEGNLEFPPIALNSLMKFFRTKKFFRTNEIVKIARINSGLKVPHMGWNDLRILRPHPVLEGVSDGDHAYFVHSYHLRADDPGGLLAETDYGGPVTAIVGRDNLVGCQFHPEKSQATGLRIIANFLAWSP